MSGHPWWLVALAAIGAIALAGVLLGLFSNLGEGPGRGTITRVVPVGSREFLLALAGSTNAPLREGGEARLHDNGDAFWPAIFAALEAAERSINLMVYIWEPGAVSARLFDVLVERARAGVQVRVMVDGLGGHKAPKERSATTAAPSWWTEGSASSAARPWPTSGWGTHRTRSTGATPWWKCAARSPPTSSPPSCSSGRTSPARR